MCLLIDSLEGIEETSFSSEENAPVAKTREPYAYLASAICGQGGPVQGVGTGTRNLRIPLNEL